MVMQMVKMFALVLFAGMSALAATYNASTGYVTLTTVGSAGTESPFNAQTNIDVSAYNKDKSIKYFWSDHLPIHAGTNYYLSSGIRTSYYVSNSGPTNFVVPAKVVMAGTAALQWKTFYPGCQIFDAEGLFMEGSVWYVNQNVARPVWVDGTVTLIQTPGGQSFRIRPFGYETTYADGLGFRIDAKIVGDASQLIKIEGFQEAGITTANPAYSIPHSGYVTFGGDLTSFYGTMNVMSNRLNLATSLAHVADVQLGNCSELALMAPEGGAVEVSKITADETTTLFVNHTNTLTVGTLSLGDGATLRYSSDGTAAGCLTVTDSFSAVGQIAFGFDLPNLSTLVNDAPAAFPVLKVATTAGTLSADQFVPVRHGTRLAVPSPNPYLLADLPHCIFKVKEEDGYYVLYAVWRQLVRMTKSNEGSANAKYYNDATYWTNGKTPDENKELDFSPGRSFYLPGSKPVPGYSMTIDGRTWTINAKGRTSFHQLNIVGNSTLRTWTGASSPVEVAGPLTFYRVTDTDAFRTIIGNTTTLTNACEMTGDTAMNITIRKPDTIGKEQCATYVPVGLNTNYFGKWTVQYATENPDYLNATQYMNFVVCDQRNLGGPLPAFAYDALTIKTWQALNAGVARTVLDDVTRGIALEDQARLIVTNGRELVLSVPLTISGTVLKEAPGTLTLASAVAPKFQGATQSETPTEGQNGLFISGGALRVAAPQAVNGLALTFAAGTELCVTSQPEAVTGFLATAWEQPIACADGFDGPVPVVVEGIDADQIGNGRTVRVPVCTVTATSAETVASRLTVKRLFKGMAGTIEKQENGDGTVTLTAVVSVGGTLVIFR